MSRASGPKKTQNIKQEQYCKKLIKNPLKMVHIQKRKKKNLKNKMKKLEGIVLSKISQKRQTNAVCNHLYAEAKRKTKGADITKRRRIPDTENKLAGTHGDEERGRAR